MTVLGSIDPSALGFTSIHDHVLSTVADCFTARVPNDKKDSLAIEVDAKISLQDLFYLNLLGLRSYSKDNWDMADPCHMENEVALFRKRGGCSILETSAPGIRGDIRETKKISEKTGIHIIASTGLYVGVSWPDAFRTMDELKFKDYLRREINVGIDGSDIRAGHIKAAIRSGEGDELKIFKASPEVSRDTNILMTAHTSRGTTPENRRKMLHLLLKSGISPDKILLCHIHFTFWEGDFVSHFIDPTTKGLQLSWAKEVMDLGVNISIDCFGEQPGPWDSVRLAGLIALIQAGYTERIVIGNDVYMKCMTRGGGGYGYCAILDYVIPELKKYGVSEKEIRQITIENPMRILAH